MSNKLRVGLLFGGRSAEHDVSVVSARSVMAALDPTKYEVIPIGITRDGRWLLNVNPQRALADQLHLASDADSLQLAFSPPTALTDPHIVSGFWRTQRSRRARRSLPNSSRPKRRRRQHPRPVTTR